MEKIYDHSVETWEDARADAYVRRIFAVARELAERPRLGRPRDDVLPGYRSRLVGSHVLFFRETQSGIEVIRILHQRMDVDL